MTQLNVSLLVAIAVQTLTIAWLVMDRVERMQGGRSQLAGDKQIRFIVDHVPVMLWTARPNKDLDYLNQTCAEFTGLPLKDLLGAAWFDTVHPEDLEPCAKIYTPAFEAQEPFAMEFRMRRNDGVYRWMLDIAVPKFEGGVFDGYVGCSIDVTERRQAEEENRQSRDALEQSHGEIQQLAGQLINAHEDERRRLAGELHDDLTQRLALLAIEMGQLKSGVGLPDSVRALRESLIHLSKDVHALAYRLHPALLDDLGLGDALRTECDRVTRNGGLSIELHADDIPEDLPCETSLCLFRIAQEALSNAMRHAQAHNIEVRLSSIDGGLRLAVSDDGSGFDATRPRASGRLGLASMRERVRILRGTFNIESQPGGGTTVVAWVPA